MKSYERQFPTWMYHKDKAAMIFYTPDELNDGGEGWYDSPVCVNSGEEQTPVEEIIDQTTEQIKEVINGI